MAKRLEAGAALDAAGVVELCCPAPKSEEVVEACVPVADFWPNKPPPAEGACDAGVEAACALLPKRLEVLDPAAPAVAV